MSKKELLRGLAVPLGPALLMLAIGSYQLTRRAMWGDEYATWYAATLPPEDLVRLLGNADAVLAPYYLFMHGWIAVSGDSLVALRAPSVLAVAATAGMIPLIGRRLVGTPAGAGAGLLFCLVPSMSRYAQEARPYAFAIAGSQQKYAIAWITLNRWAVVTFPVYLIGSAVLAGVLALLALAGAVTLAAAHRSALAVLLAWALVPPLFCLVTFPLAHLFLARYRLFTVPAWCLLATA